jgi:hypothetical protein
MVLNTYPWILNGARSISGHPIIVLHWCPRCSIVVLALKSLINLCFFLNILHDVSGFIYRYCIPIISFFRKKQKIGRQCKGVTARYSKKNLNAKLLQIIIFLQYLRPTLCFGAPPFAHFPTEITHISQ